MGESVEEGSTEAAAKPKPTILVPPRTSMEFLTGSGPGFSPGPMTLVSNLFPENSPFSFSQLLAGAMASPMAANNKGFSSSDLGKEGKIREAGAGNKVNRPVAVAPLQVPMENLSSLFVAPPGLSPGFLNSPGFLSPLQSPFGMSHQQALAHVTAQAAYSQSFKQMQADYHNSASTDAQPNNPSSTPNDPESSKIESSEASLFEKRHIQASGDKPANDGYNWRKYGQKQVKASECPRSYYKCTNINCPVKKKVERSPDGRVSEITYKGQHNHEPPQPQKRGKDNSASDKVANSQSKPILERNGLNEAMIVQSESPMVNLPSAEHHAAVSSQYDDGKDTTVVVDNKGDFEEPATKRRNTDTGTSITATTHQTVTESKIVLQTRSEVDLLDDGFKWRKYGQKVVKGNPYPRSYYRCTFQGCNVRKHVERASADPKAVITTYEGKHNHDAPVGRHGNNSNSSHQSKTAQKTGPRNNEESSELEKKNKDQIPLTLQLKEEQIAA